MKKDQPQTSNPPSPPDSIGGEMLMGLIGDLEFIVAYEQRQRAAHFHSRPEKTKAAAQADEFRQRLGRIAGLVKDEAFLRMLLAELGALERPDLQDYVRSVFAYRHEPSLESRTLTPMDLILKEYVSGKHHALTSSDEQQALANRKEVSSEALENLERENELLKRTNKDLLETLRSHNNRVLQAGELATTMVSLMVNYLNDRMNLCPPTSLPGKPRQADFVVHFRELEAPLLQMLRKLKTIEQTLGKPIGYSGVKELISSLFSDH